MRSELIILFGLASFMQGSYVPTLKITYYGLTNQQTAVLNKIIGNQEAAGFANYEAVKSLFAILYDLDTTADEDNSRISKVLVRLKEAVEISFDSHVIALKKSSCSVVRSVRNAVQNHVNNAAVHIATAIKLARSGNYYENRNAIEVNRVKVEKDFTKAIKGFYEPIFTCLGNTNAEVPAKIQTAYDGSLRGLIHLTNAFFNAITITEAASTSRYEESADIPDIKDFKYKAWVGARDTIEFKFVFLKSFFIYSNLQRGGILSELFSNQYAVTASYRGFAVANTVVFDRIVDYLTRIYFGLSDDGILDFSKDDLALHTAITFYNRADGANFESIFALYPDATRAIAAAQQNVFNNNAKATISFFDAIHVVVAKGGNYSYVTDYIAASKNAAAALAPNYVREYVRVIRQNLRFDSKIETEFARITKLMTDGSVYCTNSIFEAIGILAEATRANGVRADDFNAVQNLLDTSISGCDQFTQGVSAANILVLVATNAS